MRNEINTSLILTSGSVDSCTGRLCPFDSRLMVTLQFWLRLWDTALWSVFICWHWELADTLMPQGFDVHTHRHPLLLSLPFNCFISLSLVFSHFFKIQLLRQITSLSLFVWYHELVSYSSVVWVCTCVCVCVRSPERLCLHSSNMVRFCIIS